VLPQFQTDLQELSLLQNKWAAQLNPLLSSPVINGQFLTSVVLSTGSNVINHKLGRPLQGWVVVRQRALASLYDTQDTNPTPAITLRLVSSANVTVDLLVF
jgi:hypothetical protein